MAGEEPAGQVIERLKRQNMAALQDLERLVIVLEKKVKEQAIINHLKVAMGRGKPIRSLAHLQEVMEPGLYAKLIKTALN